MMTLETYKRSFGQNSRSYSFTDCTVRDRNIFVFIASKILTNEEIEEYGEKGMDTDYRPKFLATYYRDEPVDDQWGWETLPLEGYSNGYCDSMIIGSMDIPQNHSISIERTSDNNKSVFISGGGSTYEDKPLADC